MNVPFALVCTTTSAAQTQQLGESLAGLLRAGDAIVLVGDLGVGKTQFVQGVARGLGIGTPVVSPTFNILIPYTEGVLPLYHFDLYRLDSEDQLEDVGYFDTIEGDGATLLEWADKFPDSLPYDYLVVDIRKREDASKAPDERVVRIGACGSRAETLLGQWAAESEVDFGRID